MSAPDTYGGVVFADCRIDFEQSGTYWSLTGPLCRSQTQPGGFVVADKRNGGDYVFPLAGRDVEVYLPGEEDPIIQYKGTRCVRGEPK